MTRYNKDSIVMYKTPEIYTDFLTSGDSIFEEHHVYIDGQFKYIVALFQDGDIWSENENWGTYIIDVDTLTKDRYCQAMTYPFYVGDPALTIRNDFILNDEWKPDIELKIK